MRLRQTGRLAISFLVLLGISCLAAKNTMAESAIRSVGADGTQFKVELDDGRVLNSPDLVGAVLGIQIDGKLLRFRIDTITRDSSAQEYAIWLHGFSVEQPDGSWKNLCSPGPDGRALGFPLAGNTRANGTLDMTDNKQFSLVCTSSAQAKCVRFGYAPWVMSPDGASLGEAFNACVLMLRADYAGDNSPTTRDGTEIGITDRWNIRNSGDDDPAYQFEAGWDASGAVCVHHPRIRENISLATLGVEVPRLAGKTGAICTEEFARSLGALIFNRSKVN